MVKINLNIITKTVIIVAVNYNIAARTQMREKCSH